MLKYIVDCTQPDISFVTNQLAKYLNNPDMEHYLVLKHCYQYLKTINNVWLQLRDKNKNTLNRYTDTDSMMQEGHYTISGYTFYLNDSLVSWSSKRQTLVANSTYKAELIALTRGTQEAIAYMHLAEEILQVLEALINIYCNNDVVIKTVTLDKIKYSEQTKYLDHKKDFIKCYIELQYINIKYIQTNKQITNIMTKALHVLQIKHLTSQLRLVNV